MKLQERVDKWQRGLLKPSIVVLIFSASFAFWFNDLLKPYNPPKQPSNFAWDAAGYYSYLPATFYFNAYQLFPGEQGYQQLPKDSVLCTKFTYGVALLEAPWYFCGYAMAAATNQSLIGYSTPFADAIRFGEIIYLFIGLLFLRKYLLLFFEEKIVALTLLSLLFGTLLYMYGLISVEMSHGFLFSLFALFLWYTHKWHSNPTHRHSVILAILLAIISIVRITEIYMIAIFVFYGVRKFSDIQGRIKLFLGHWTKLLWFPILAIVFWIPQMIVWKQCFGSYVTQPYTDETFFWLDPQVINVLFSVRKGWFVYTPMAAFAIIGIFCMRRELPFSPLLIIFLLAMLTYVYSCWWYWTYGGCFGARAFCQLIAWLAIPLASFYEKIFRTTTSKFMHTLQGLTFFAAFSMIFLNMSQSYQFQDQRLLHPSDMGKELYRNLFRKFQYGPDFINGYGPMLQPEDVHNWRKGINRDDKNKPEDAK